MAASNILIRTRVASERSWESIHRAVAMENWLRDVWPEGRVTVFAEGDAEVQDFLYSRVRDLVSLVPGIAVSDEEFARSSRGPADLVIFDAGRLTPEQRRIWRPRTRNLVVREGLLEKDPIGRRISARFWSDDAAVEEPPEILRGVAWDIVAPPQTREAELPPVPSKVVFLSHDLLDSRWLRTLGTALKSILPGAVIASPRVDPAAQSVNADLALVIGADLALQAQSARIPAFVVSRDEGEVQLVADLVPGGGLYDLGSVATFDEASVVRAFTNVVTNPGEYRALASWTPAAADGQGLARLLQRLLPTFPLASFHEPVATPSPRDTRPSTRH